MEIFKVIHLFPKRLDFRLEKSLYLALVRIINLIQMLSPLGHQYRTVECVWGGKPCLEFQTGKERRQAFCNEPNVRDLFPRKINYKYVLQCSQLEQKWHLCYNDFCKPTKHECKAVGARKFR